MNHETLNAKAIAYDLAIKCKGTYEVSTESEGQTGKKELVIDYRPVLEIAKEIYKWFNED